MSRLILVLVIAICAAFSASVVSPTAAQQPDRSIVGEVQVEGRDFSGGVFWVVILPADINQPVDPEEAKRFAVRTESGRFQARQLSQGRYFVALVIAPSELAEPAPTSVEVIAPDWVRNSSSAESGFWPAYEVNIAADTTEVEVTFRRKEYRPLPDGFVFPHTSRDDFEPRAETHGLKAALDTSEARTLRLIGAALTMASLGAGGLALVLAKRKAVTR